ncbi:unnamed protein product [Brassica oleracea]
MENEIGKKGSPSMSRNSSIGYYYQRRSEGVPFKWEMQPGTPINTQTTEMIPPLSPPPAMLSLGFPKPSISVEEPKHSVFPAKLKLRKWKYIRCRKYFSRLANKMVLPSIRLYPEKRKRSFVSKSQKYHFPSTTFQMAEEQEIRRHVVLTKPYSLEDEKDSEHTAANVIRRILSLLKNVRPGSDLTNFQLPPQLNLPKSQLQCYGEMIYSFGGHDLLGECSRRDLPIERLKSVVAWNISKLRPVLFGQAPYNPVLGETHHVSSGHINVLIEQVSHHPPVSALQATHEEENIDVMWVQHFIPKFRGAYVELEVKGKRVMKLQSRKETYDMNQPRLVIRLVPVPRADWAGKMKIKCPETDLEAELHLVSDSFIERFRGNNNRAVKGKISESSSGSKLYDIFGNWDSQKDRVSATTFLMAEEEETRKHLVIAKPFALEDDKDSEHAASNGIRRILSLFKDVRLGSDLTNFQLPPQLNQPRSQLQCYGEMIYSFCGQDLIGECSRRDLPIERLKSVVAWNISTLRPIVFGMSPYNPVLGETHHVSHGHINVLTEQVSHHPPVSALHATHENENIDVTWCQYFTPKFRGAYVDVEVKGKRTMKLLNRKETYEMDQPRLVVRFLPAPGAHWTGKIKIKCPETDLEAELHLISDSFIERFKGNNNRSIKGKISQTSSGDKLYDISGHWDRTISAKNLKTGEVEVIYNAKESISGLRPPTVKNLKEVMESESAMVWSEVSEKILNKDWERAREAKKAVEEKQRESLKRREASGESWVPKHFSVVRNGKDWDCSPLQPTVPRAPLVITEAQEENMN